MTRKVLVAVHVNVQGTVNLNEPLRYTVQFLKKLGYEPEVRTIFEGTTQLTGITQDDYAFIVSPYLSTGAPSWANTSEYAKALDGSLPLACFVLGPTANNAVKYKTTFGAAARTYIKEVQCDWDGQRCWGEGCDYALDPAFTYTTLVTTPNDGAKAWIKHGTSGNVYVDSGPQHNGDKGWFYVLLQEAINRGDVTELPTKRLPAMFDLDDAPNMDASGNTIAEMETIYGLQTQYGMPVTWGLQTGSPWDANGTAEQKAFLAARTPDKGGLIYAIEHNSNLYADGMTESEIDTQYKSEVAVMAASGISQGWNADGLDAWGFRYFNNNNFNDVFMNANINFDYGIKVFRSDAGTTADGIGEPNNGPGKLLFKGTRVISSNSPWAFNYNSNTPGSDQEAIDYDNIQRSLLWIGAVWDAPLYMHAKNFFDGHDGGTGIGEIALGDSLAVGAKCPDIFEFIHPSALAES